MMTSLLVRSRSIVLVAGILVHGYWAADGFAEPPGDDPLVVRLVHPDRQAAEVLRLFEGSGMPHPAAALAAWKLSAPNHGSLGKPLEAVIAFFNPEMAREWSVLHDAELRLNLSAAGGVPRWHAFVPRDDGTIAAAVTALHLTDGGAEPPLGELGSALQVERLGPPGAMVATRLGDSVIFGSSPDELFRAVRRIQTDPAAPGAANSEKGRGSGIEAPRDGLESGLLFVFDPLRLHIAKDGPLAWRRAAEVFRALECARLEGKLALHGERLALDVTTALDRRAPAPRPEGVLAAVDFGWLKLIPAAGVMGLVSAAFEPSAAFWNTAFAVADRVDRADPAHAALAPLRSRVDLLAAAAGASLETDLWPHLKGLTACLVGAGEKPGTPTCALFILHVDGDAAAERIATEVVPRMANLLSGTKPQGQPRGAVAAGSAQRLGMVKGQPLTEWRRGRDVLVAWGDEVETKCRDVDGRPERSVAALCNGWAQAGKRPPQRIAAVWPARCWGPPRNLAADAPGWHVLEEDPPVVWCGWNDLDSAFDSIDCSGLRERIRRFMDRIPPKMNNER